MSHVCCVKLCGSKQGGKNNPRCLFRITPDSSNYIAVLNAIGHHLKQNKSAPKILYVCDLHYEKSCLLTSGIKIWKDGLEVTLTRQKRRLKDNSTPTIFAFETLAQCKETLTPTPVKESSVQKIGQAVPGNCNQPQNLQIDSEQSDECKDHEGKEQGHREQEQGHQEYEQGHREQEQGHREQEQQPSENVQEHEQKEQEPFTRNTIIERWKSLVQEKKAPAHWGLCNNSLGLALVYFGDGDQAGTRTILVKDDMSFEVRYKGTLGQIPRSFEKIKCFEDLQGIIVQVTFSRICEGIEELPLFCENIFFIPKPHSRSQKCSNCQKKSRKIKVNEYRRAKRSVLKEKKEKKYMRNMTMKYKRAMKKVGTLSQQVEELMEQCSVADEKALDNIIKEWPEKMKEAMKACYSYAKKTDKRGMRYKNQWILECLLLRMKSGKTYRHIQENKILAVPSVTTLNRYIKNLKPSYGFDPSVFAMMKKKGQKMDEQKKRGSLIIDEMQISEGICFDQKNMTVLGFTDLGQYTPEEQKKSRGDHALVFLFQPFQGRWVQSVGAFLSKGAANGDVLFKLIAECTILLENSGFFVDVVTTDGANWNRNMWKKFGLKDNDCSCVHPCAKETDFDDESSTGGRRLWFCSDFSHLVKNLRNFLMSTQEIMTPDGVFKKKHFEAVLACDGGTNHLGFKIAHKLTPDHLDPKVFQKMRVSRAVEVFAPEVSSAMKIYTSQHPDLKDCESTTKFIERVYFLITAMTSRSALNSLKKDNDSYQAISSFISYMDHWETQCKEKNYKFMPSNTATGLKVTLRTTLEVMTFLTNKCHYMFLMTSRLNQDALEGLFGMIRACCGSHDKPDPILFIQIYRFVCFYSLVKPPKGSNVEGVEIFETLLTMNQAKTHENVDDFNKMLDEIIEGGEERAESRGVRHEHDYRVVRLNLFAQSYFSGFVARKVKLWTECDDCIASVTKKEGNSEKDSMINYMSKGFLTYPSDILVNLLVALEMAVLQTIGEEQMNIYTFQHIVQNVCMEKLTFVGCPLHEKQLTKSIVSYYLVARTKILCKMHNSVYNEARKKEQHYRKMSKLVKTSENGAAVEDEQNDFGTKVTKKPQKF